jgi:hypothetical protein
MSLQLKITPKRRGEMRALCIDLPMMEARLRRAGLLATAARLNMAVKEIGHEVVRLEEKTAKP